jgi:hypothetical protein
MGWSWGRKWVGFNFMAGNWFGICVQENSVTLEPRLWMREFRGIGGVLVQVPFE